MQVQTIAGGDCLTTEYTLPDGLREELAAIDGVVRCTCLELEGG